MKVLSQQHICKLYQVIETEEKFFMILEVNSKIDFHKKINYFM